MRHCDESVQGFCSAFVPVYVRRFRVEEKAMDLFEAAGVSAEHHYIFAPDAYRDAEFDAEEIEWFTTAATVRELSMWYHDMLECDDDMGRRSRRTRQLRAIIKRRGISDVALGEALRG
jgi:hypothetical protein